VIKIASSEWVKRRNYVGEWMTWVKHRGCVCRVDKDDELVLVLVQAGMIKTRAIYSS
jgi:hypothetical protein